MERFNRRAFLGQSARFASAASVGTLAFSTVPPSVLGANERVNLALIGCGGRGRIVARGLIECGARFTYACDLHEERRESVGKELADAQKAEVKRVADMRDVFDAAEIDAVVVATPDHWHAGITVQACQAGKDVYVEKPHAHSLWESRQMARAVRKYRRVVQVGTQNRSGPYNHKALDYIKTGKLGDIHLVKVYNLKSGGPFHLGDAGTPPQGFDWDAWLGPAPHRPYHQRVFHGGWHHFWDFSNGDMADDGIHQMDLALMLMGDPGFPQAVSCMGGRLAHQGDDSETPDVQLASFDFGTFVMTFELTQYPRYMQKTTGTIRRNDEFPYWTQNATRIELYGADLMMTVGRHGGGWIVQTSGGRVVEKCYGRPADQPHEANFLECIRTRKQPNADAETLHRSAALIYLGCIAHRVGNQTLRFDSQAERFVDNRRANELIKPAYRRQYSIPDQV
ncbi:MAG: Gfo/Idh/MocA family oxidoreductase [Phycisphaerales bacterium]|nr:MAG: Gfo/Idh/MocA family oxidoreductase [Phycisphaerales bacterium]